MSLTWTSSVDHFPKSLISGSSATATAGPPGPAAASSAQSSAIVFFTEMYKSSTIGLVQILAMLTVTVPGGNYFGLCNFNAFHHTQRDLNHHFCEHKNNVDP